MPAEIRQLKGEAKAEVLRAISEGLLMDKEQIARVMNDPKSNMAQMLVGSVILAAIKHGDVHRFGTLINYVMGKPKPLGSSWHDDPPSDDGPSPQTALKQIPSAMLIEMIRRTNAPTGSDTGG